VNGRELVPRRRASSLKTDCEHVLVVPHHPTVLLSAGLSDGPLDVAPLHADRSLTVPPVYLSTTCIGAQSQGLCQGAPRRVPPRARALPHGQWWRWSCPWMTVLRGEDEPNEGERERPPPPEQLERLDDVKDERKLSLLN